MQYKKLAIQGEFVLIKKHKNFKKLPPNPGQAIKSMLQGTRYAHKESLFIFIQYNTGTG